MIPQHPDVIYKITTVDAWAAAVAAGQFDGSADDRRDGFIHLSASHQLQGTAGRYFAGQNQLLLVAVDAAALGGALRWEASRGGDLFPHCYGPLPVSAAVWVRPLPLDPSGLPAISATLLTPDHGRAAT
jgi:uncharacterized protein (DUF952 family)